ncbi:short-chain fatty acid transporter [Halomonas sp. MES3-P3E]|uniref:short-chain fatty acid transporter n=1 Tax=Halomonas sp. MES3-P3E TaxID=2058321 RepID=UPI000C34233F|nr:TIGR00366 family protein [Halomonas sp. MES3-P3E]PKG48793.1 short-chain fatty acid transporter [Halomonas sp. MES3-P3E]
MIKHFTNGCVRLFDRYLPDPFVLVVLITLVVFCAGILFEGQSPVAMLDHWRGGFWSLHTFAMQMALILLTGFIVAKAPLFTRLVERIASVARTPERAIVLVTLTSLIVTWVNWGIGLVIGAILARELARRVPLVDYRLLIASAYSGFLVWHGGLSGAVPLTLATPGHFLESSIGLIPTSQTLLSSFNLFILAALLVALPLTNRLMMRNIDQPVTLQEVVEVHPEVLPAKSDDDDMRPAQRLERSVWLARLIGAMGLAAMAVYALANGGGLTLDVVIFALLFIGILLHGTLRRYLDCVQEGISGASGVLIQFPFYAGIMGMMSASGLTSSMAQLFIEHATPATLPALSFISAGIINIFVPSGGGQWAVQGPILMEAAQALNADIAKVAMAFAWGDSWTNMLQPFWALPALAIAGLKARDIMGFCAVILLVSGIIIGGTLLILP